MNRLEYHFDCLDGNCLLVCEAENGTLHFTVTGNNPVITEKAGELSEVSAFEKLLKEAGIESWDRKYEPQTEGIEDAIRWKVVYQKDGKEYVSSGEESYEPYGYEKLIEALKLFEPEADYFLAKAE